ncbi:PqqD family protein [Spirulina sp. 06S082]|uniref:PqqD family protein n=1 Tax=Spirulina sp. 06S082 TaxID=3110248 RepID=UPI002B21E0CB|nr:PqqD family protein [Spirulina sp. 06S082]MEA5471522.1 PqqD family protein [Spirulina sp. 06S082]
MSDLSLTQKVSLSEDVLLQDLAGESVLLNLDSEEYFGLDEVGTRMISILNDAPSIQAAYQLLLAEYEVDGIELEQDLLELIEQLAEHGLVKVTGS